MKKTRFRVVVNPGPLSPSHNMLLACSGAVAYVKSIAGKGPLNNRYKATATTTDPLHAASFTFNIAQAVARRNRGILSTI